MADRALEPLIGRNFLGNKLTIVLVRDKTDFVAVGFIRGAQAIFARQLADFRFGEPSQREKEMGQLFLAETVEDVGLIFGGIDGFLQDEPLRVVIPACRKRGSSVFGKATGPR